LEKAVREPKVTWKNITKCRRRPHHRLEKYEEGGTVWRLAGSLSYKMVLGNRDSHEDR